MSTISHRPYEIGIAGGTASGKTTMTNTIVRTVGPSRVVIIAYDSYYKDLSHVPLAERLQTTNFDHPDSLDTPLLALDRQFPILGAHASELGIHSLLNLFNGRRLQLACAK